MEENMKRLFFMAALLALGFSLVFAGGGQQGGGQQPVPEGGYGPRVSGQNYWLAKYPQEMTIHVVNREYPQSLSQMAAGDNMSSNQWIRGLKQYLNINVVTDWVSTVADYPTKLNLAIASGEIPDMFRVDAVQYRQLMEGGLLADLTDYTENNLSDHVKEIMAFDPAVTNSAKVDGRLYAIPIYGYGPIDDFPILVLRHDWMQGKTAPKTVAELEKLMQTFMREHPGTYGTALSKSLNEMYNLGPAFKAYPNAWIKKNGKIEYGRVQPEMKPLLQTFADWYKKGYILKDFMSQDDTAMRQDVVSGKFGVQLSLQWWGYAYGADVVKNLGNEAYSEAYPIPTVDGSKPVHSVGFENGGYLVVNKKFKNPDVGLKCTSFVLWVNDEALAQRTMSATEMQSYVLANSEGQHTMYPFEIYNILGEIINFNQIQEAKKTRNTAGMNGTALSKYESARACDVDRAPDGFGNWFQNYAEKSSYEVNLEVINDKRYFSTELMGPAPEDLASYGSTLDDLLTEGFTQIITGAQPVSYFDSLVQQWKAVGGDTVTAAVNRDYNK
jgi:putative aldouronate transport system substrate-binding protein